VLLLLELVLPLLQPHWLPLPLPLLLLLPPLLLLPLHQCCFAGAA
jgi:hypothetical protein